MASRRAVRRAKPGDRFDGEGARRRPPRDRWGRFAHRCPRSATGCVYCHRLRLHTFGALPFAVALDPDTSAFFGGLQAAITAGAIVVIALVVVHAVKRFTNF